MNIFRPIVSFGSKVLQFFVPSTTATVTNDRPVLAIPKDKTFFGVEYWLEIIDVEIGASTQVRDNATISQVKWLKARGGLAHEFLVFTLDFKEPACTTFLKIERAINQEAVQEAIHQDDPLELFPESSVAFVNEADRPRTRKLLLKYLKDELKLIKDRKARSLHRWIPSLNPVEKGAYGAMDVISKVGRATGRNGGPDLRSFKCKTLSTLTIPEGVKKLSLRDLGIITTEVNNYRPVYKLKDTNCYWFARTVFNVVFNLTSSYTVDYPPPIPAEIHLSAGHVSNVPKLGPIVEHDPDEVVLLLGKIWSSIRENDAKIMGKWQEDRRKIYETVQERLTQERQVEGATEDMLTRERQAHAEKEAAMQATINRLQAQLAAITNLATRSSIATQ